MDPDSHPRLPGIAAAAARDLSIAGHLPSGAAPLAAPVSPVLPAKDLQRLTPNASPSRPLSSLATMVSSQPLELAIDVVPEFVLLVLVVVEARPHLPVVVVASTLVSDPSRFSPC